MITNSNAIVVAIEAMVIANSPLLGIGDEVGPKLGRASVGEGFIGVGVMICVCPSPMVIVWVLLQSLDTPVNCDVPITATRIGSHDV
jgi:hypothetical protein